MGSLIHFFNFREPYKKMNQRTYAVFWVLFSIPLYYAGTIMLKMALGFDAGVSLATYETIFMHIFVYSLIPILLVSTIKRLNDIGLSVMWSLLLLTPLNILMFLFFLLAPSDLINKKT